MADRYEDHPPVDPAHHRKVAASLLTGVTVITAGSESELAGCTANAVTSLSLDPPMMLVCLDHGSDTLAALMRSRSFAINVLGGDPESQEICRRFAASGDDRFSGVEHTRGRTGAPLLNGALGWFDCRLGETFVCGDHRICTGLVVDAGETEDAEHALGFFRGELFAVKSPGG